MSFNWLHFYFAPCKKCQSLSVLTFVIVEIIQADCHITSANPIIPLSGRVLAVHFKLDVVVWALEAVS